MSQPADRRVAVTGLGAVTPLGTSVAESWRACSAGECAIRTHRLDPGETGPAAFDMPLALVPGDVVQQLEAALGRRIGASLDRFALHALCAVSEALGDAGLERQQLTNAGVVFGHGMGGMHTIEASYERFYGRRSTRLHPLSVPRIMVSSAVSSIAIEFGLKGPSFAASSACASSGHALAQAAMLIQNGLADIVVAGGADAIATPCGIAAWNGLHAMSPTVCRPFSKGRDGMTLGEGAAALVLESFDSARARGARIRAELAGFGMSSDASHWTQPDLAGAVSCMRMACDRAAVRDAGQILIAAHGTGTLLNDSNESHALHAVFGSRTAQHPVIATKSGHGHLIGASSAVQSVLGLCAMQDQLAPPVLNHLGRDPDCDLDLVLGAARRIRCDALLVNAFSFGGLNASLVFRPA